jgi:5,6-dimethylbenzimidazole synthase
MSDSDHAFNQAEIAAVYRAIEERRDMRHFTSQPLAPEVLVRLLRAAHHGPSVGFMQPWRFIRVTQANTRAALHALVEEERIATAHALGEREQDFMRLKVEGLRECAEVLVVALMDKREAHVFGRRTLPEMDLASAACAIQNMWLAARAEGIGMGWVSIFDPARVAALLNLPEGGKAGAKAIAILCLGHVAAFYDKPMLEQERWAKRAELGPLVYGDTWGKDSGLDL